MQYELTELAEQDLIEIGIYSDKHFGPERSRSYCATLKARLQLIAAHPELFQLVEQYGPGYRRCPCGSHAIYYKIVKGFGVRIIRILSQQNPQGSLP